VLTFEQIKELIDLVCERQLQGVELERSGFRIKIEGKEPAANRTVVQAASQEPGMVPVVVPTTKAADGSASASEESGDSSVEEEAREDGLHLLNSPIVGTFYAAPNPDADPYISVGDRVKRGQVLCIVEAMKLMNEIESDTDGVVDKIYPKNGQPVEFGEALFGIRTD
jgi:acetyl-CoA carboxylase biotin carboxyl carrier protein